MYGSPNAIPAFINNRNRLTTLRLLVEWLEQIPGVDIVILDNASTYRPLLDYYHACNHKVVRLQNLGPLAIMQSGCLAQLGNRYFVYTDSDVVPCEICPRDVLSRFVRKLQSDPNLFKVGLGLRTDDIPECFHMRDEVIAWEQKFWENRQPDGFYVANIDTTFALYDSHRFSKPRYWFTNSLRSDFPYVARHLPWYSDTANLSDEELFYLRNIDLNVSAIPFSWSQPDKYPDLSYPITML